MKRPDRNARTPADHNFHRISFLAAADTGLPSAAVPVVTLGPVSLLVAE